MMKFKEFCGLARLDEAAFGPDKIAKVSLLYSKLLGKKFGAPFVVLGSEKFKKSGGVQGQGIRMINDKGYQIRLNLNRLGKGFNQKFAKTALVISSVDYWDPKNRDFDKPTLSANFDEDTNVIQIWDELAKIFKQRKIGKFELTGDNDGTPAGMSESVEIDLVESAKIPEDDFELNEIYVKKGNTGKRLQFAAQKGYDNPQALSRDKAAFELAVLNHGDAEEWNSCVAGVEVKAGKEETNTFNDGLKAAQKKLDDTVYSDPKLVFQDIEDMVKVVAKGKTKSLVICGDAGVGKTFHVTKAVEEVLGKESPNFVVHKGMKASPRAFYKDMFMDAEKCVILDEADPILNNEDIIIMLKSALDTSGTPSFEYLTGTARVTGNQAEVRAECDSIREEILAGAMPTFSMNGKVGQNAVILPSKFYFDGSMIFISNLPYDKIDDAVKSRSLFIDVHLCAKDTFNRMKSIFMLKNPSMPDADVDKVFNMLGIETVSGDEDVTYASPEVIRKKGIKRPSMRTLELFTRLSQAGIDVDRACYLASMYA